MARRRLLLALLLLCGCLSFPSAAGESSTTPSNTVSSVVENTSVAPTSAANTTTAPSANLTSTSEVATHHPTTASDVSETSALTGRDGNTTHVMSTTSWTNRTNATSQGAPSSFESGTTESSTSPLPSTSSETSIAPKPSVMVNLTLTNSTGEPLQQPLSQKNPGLIAVLCIFAAVLAIVVAVVLVKVCQRGGPRFKKLEELPMNSVSEEAPFARYPPK